MTRADEIHIVAPGLAIWQAYDPGVKCDLTSVALIVSGRLVLIDPIALSAAGVSELEEAGQPALIVCTNGNHARAADSFRRHYRVPLAAHAEARLETSVDLPLADGSRVLDAIEVCTLPGAGPGEVVLIDPRGIVCVGDALIDLPPHGFSVLPDKYCTDPKLLRESLRKLLRWDFKVLTFAHGWPLVASARERLAALLA
ncbi:MAG: hypothetical protein ABMA13_13670 [Chthoniobacteraceae bacterium]